MNTPTEVHPLAHYLCEEMEARGWTSDDVALRMGGDEEEVARNMLVVNLILSVHKDSLVFEDATLAKLAKAFDVSAAFFRNLDAIWRDHPDRRIPFTPPESIFGPISTSCMQA